MGCNISYCQEENKINIKETLKASNQYYNTNRKTQRIIEKCKRTYSEITIDRNISDEEESTKKITGESYKRVLIDLIERQRIENQQKSRGDYSTYMVPFKQLVENTNPQKFERLYLNLKAATSEARDILVKLDYQEPDKTEMQRQLQTFVEDMVRQDRNQYQLKIKKTLSTPSVFENPSLQMSPSYHLANVNNNNNNNENLKQSGLNNFNNNNNNAVSDVWEVNRNDSFFGNKGHSMSFKGNASFQLPNELIEHSMSNPFQDFSCPQVQIQKFLFNYLYEKVGKNQHIVRDLIDKFSELICDKFNITQGSEPLSGFDLESMTDIELSIRNDILFFVDLLKKYLNEIYGKQLLEPKFNQNQKNDIFDIFVRKVVFDDTYICAIARTAISLSHQKSIILLKKLFAKLKQKITVKNAFYGKLKFISKDDRMNPFESLDELFEDICCTSSPFLKQVQFKELRDKMIKILDGIQQKQKSKKKKISTLKLEADDFTAIYNFVILYAKPEIFLEVQFIELYGTRTSSCPVFSFLTGIYDKFIMCSEDPDHGVSQAMELFKENSGEDGQIEEEKSFSNIDEIEEDDASSKMSILENHNRTLTFKQNQPHQMNSSTNNPNNSSKIKAKQDKFSFTLSSSATYGGAQKNQPRTQSEGSLKINFNYNNIIQDTLKTTVERDSQPPNNQSSSSANCLTLNDATKIFPQNISVSSKAQDSQATLHMNRAHQTSEEHQQQNISTISSNIPEQVKNAELNMENTSKDKLLEDKQISVE